MHNALGLHQIKEDTFFILLLLNSIVYFDLAYCYKSHAFKNLTAY